MMYDKKRLPFTEQYTALVQTGARSKFKSDCGGKIQMGLFYKMSKKIYQNYVGTRGIRTLDFLSRL